MAASRQTAFELADEAWALLRQVPVRSLAWYYLPTAAVLIVKVRSVANLCR